MKFQTDPARLRAWLKNAAAGDPIAWRSLVDQYASRVYGLLLKQCHDPELAEELTQATFVKIVQALDHYQEQNRFEPWLFRIATNKLRDEMRRRKRHATPMDMRSGQSQQPTPWQALQPHVVAQQNQTQQNDPQQLAQAQEQIQKLKHTMAQMSPADRQILQLRHVAGLSFSQIAQTLEQPLGTVLARGHRALKKLKTQLTAENNPST